MGGPLPTAFPTGIKNMGRGSPLGGALQNLTGAGLSHMGEQREGLQMLSETPVKEFL